MALKFTLKKKDYDNDERTIPSDDFLALAAQKADIRRHKEIPQTELPKK